VGTPADRGNDSYRVVDIDPHNPIHQAIVSNPSGHNVVIKEGRLHFPLPGARRDEAPAAPVAKPAAEKPKAVAKKAAPAKPAEKPVAKPVEKPAVKKAVPAKKKASEDTGIGLSKPVKNIQRPGAALERARADEERNARIRAARAAKEKK
jgi:hypothetical protein